MLLSRVASTRGESLAALLLCLSFVGYPFVTALADVLAIEGNLVSILYRAVCLGLAIFVIFMNLRVGMSPTVRSVYGLLLLVIGLYGMRLLSNVLLDPQSLGRPPTQYLLFYFGVTLVPLLAVMLARNLDLDLAFDLMLLFASMATFLSFFAANSALFRAREDLQRGSLESLNSISLGNLGVMLVILCIWALLKGRATGSTMRLMFLALIAAGLGISVFAASRGPLVSLAAVILALLIWVRGRSRRHLATLIFLLVSVQLLRGGTDSSLIFRRFQAFAENRDMSSSIRMQLYSDALNQISEHPFFGISIEVPSFHFYPHNLFLEYFMATGIFAGLLFVLFIVMTLFRGIKLMQSGSEHAWVYLLFLHAFVGALFSGALYSNQMMWITAALTLALPSGSGKLAQKRTPGATVGKVKVS